jgi:D-3-phosphoglycerate dehydrogenase
VAIGCFCIGTNQVDLEAAAKRGIPVFNAPFSNTRSVAELVMAEVILLLRGVPQRSAAAHRGEWQKSATGAFECRGKTLGIIGYGNIGMQLGVIAESLGMKVVYFDVAAMRSGSILINASRGNVVDLDALAEALNGSHIGGAAIDVFPVEPRSNNDEFISPLRGLDQCILTPHIGGSTQEAQENIGVEVAEKLTRYSDNGTTTSAVNFPEVALPEHEGKHRLLHVHQNIPGIMSAINQAFSESAVNVTGQYLQTLGDTGYVVIDIETDYSKTLINQLSSIEGTLRTRVLF